jgi:hypothetical protein
MFTSGLEEVKRMRKRTYHLVVGDNFVVEVGSLVEGRKDNLVVEVGSIDLGFGLGLGDIQFDTLVVDMPLRAARVGEMKTERAM